MKILRLTLKKKWFDMILSGEKKEEYRDIKSYWSVRFTGYYDEKIAHSLYYNKCEVFEKFDLIIFKNGYSKNCPEMIVECKGLGFGKTNSFWCNEGGIEVFVIKLGKIISTKNI